MMGQTIRATQAQMLRATAVTAVAASVMLRMRAQTVRVGTQTVRAKTQMARVLTEQMGRTRAQVVMMSGQMAKLMTQILSLKMIQNCWKPYKGITSHRLGAVLLDQGTWQVSDSARQHLCSVGGRQLHVTSCHSITHTHHSCSSRPSL
jgi:hypothetical protein